MPCENVGDISAGEMPQDRAWIVACLNWAADYLRFSIGEPEGYRLGVIWHDHELGPYPTLGVRWDDSVMPRPEDYIWRWAHALEAFDRAVDWAAIDPERIESELDLMAEELQANYSVETTEEFDAS